MKYRRFRFIGKAPPLWEATLVLLAMLTCLMIGSVVAGELSGRMTFESRLFPDAGLADNQRRF